MNSQELIQLVGIAVGGVVAVGGIVTGILWLARGYIAKIHELHDLQEEMEPLREKAKRAESLEHEHGRDAERLKAMELDKRRMETERDLAREERNSERQERQRVTEIAKKNRDVAAENARLYRVARGRALHYESAAREYGQQIDDIARLDGRVWCAPHIIPPPQFIPLSLRANRKPVVISIFNLKGGVGKTTMTANLGGYLANCCEKWVLLLDFDHQRSLTRTLFSTENRVNASAAGRTAQQFFLSINHDGCSLAEFTEQVRGSGFDRLFVVGNSDAEEGYGVRQNLDDVEMQLLREWLVAPARRDIRYLLRSAIESPPIQERYDYVFIDCPPRLTTACVNALAASDFLLIPAQAESVSASSVPHLLRRLRPLREAGILCGLQVLGVVGNMFSADGDAANSEERKLLDITARTAGELWGDAVPLLDSTIRRSDFYASCQGEVDGRLRLPSVVVTAIREQYQKLTQELEGIINENLRVAGVPS
ncbi:MAG TPA: AAA family ATPase [Gemmata sp.]|nr:AAA family ATPase [Gemmata sp.]